jgi:ATP-dependent Clp protease protease subunit
MAGNKKTPYTLDYLHDYGIHPDTREIYLYPYYDPDGEDEPCMDWRMSATFIRNLHYLERQDTKKNILIHLNTDGGEWQDGMAIHNVIAASSCPITILAHRAARSMGSILFQAADKRVLMPDANMMLHFGHSQFQGTEIELKSFSRLSEKLNRRMFEIYIDRMIKSRKHKDKNRKQIADYIKRQFQANSDWWITSPEAVKEGLADGVFGERGFKTIEEIRK